VAGAVAAVLLVVIAGSALGLFSGINAALRSGLDANLFSTLTKVAAGDPFYVLLMGTDESVDRQDDPELGGVFRTDTIILARVDPRNQGLTMVSIPRDTKVDLGKYGEQKINAAHAFGGSVLAVQAVEELTGVKISHYVEMDFDGFIGMVDALGGVEVDVPMTIDDIDAGGHVDAGLHTLNSWEALTLCRARNAYEEVVGQGDLYRAANQRLVLAAIMKKILASDPATMTSAINSCAQYVRTDMSVGDILNLANSFRGFDSEKKLYTAVFPVESAYIDEIWWDLPQMSEWKEMRTRMEQGLSPSTENVVDPVTGTVLATAGDSAQPEGAGSSSTSATHQGLVVVRNGSTYDGAGAKAADKLEGMGFTTDVDNADADDYPKTLVVYEGASQQAEARQIADALGCGAVVQNDGSYYFEGAYLVVIGADWNA
jgi:LCP family protein required for cell wall assembly